VPDFGKKTADLVALLREGYTPRWQDVPGYKTLVDQKSEKGIFPQDTESTSTERGQSNLDSMWPVETPQSREKERVLPLPSNHDKARDKKIGPTTYNKNRNYPPRTLSEKGDEYGHPTKYDYNYVRRRQDVTAEGKEAVTSPLPKPNQRQKNLRPGYKRVLHQWYLRNKNQKKLQEKLRYRTRGKFDVQEKKYDEYYRRYPQRYKRRRRSPFNTPAERTKAWREDQQQEREDMDLSPAEYAEHREQQRETLRSRKPKPPGRKVYGFDDFLSFLEEFATDSTTDWETTVKKTQPPGQLDQNFEPSQPKSTVPRKDAPEQEGASLRAPGLDNKPQKGLKWEVLPRAPGGMPSHTVNNPGNGSGKVIPMWGDFVNNTQQVSDGRSENYLRNDNFDVKTASTIGEILARVDPKIRTRASTLAPALERTDTKNWTWHWRVGEHVVKVQAFKRGTANNLTKLNLRISCSCPFWQWWGPEHWGKKGDYLRGEPRGTATPPKIRDPKHWRPVCKHAYAVLDRSQQFFVRPSKSPLRKLGSRFSFDRTTTVEVMNVALLAAAHHHVEQESARRVARRYRERKDR
jgi:hypothetical protein